MIASVTLITSHGFWEAVASALALASSIAKALALWVAASYPCLVLSDHSSILDHCRMLLFCKLASIIFIIVERPTVDFGTEFLEWRDPHLIIQQIRNGPTDRLYRRYNFLRYKPGQSHLKQMKFAFQFWVFHECYLCSKSRQPGHGTE